MDYSKFSDETLKQMASGQPLEYAKMSDDELKEIAGSPAHSPTPAPKAEDDRPFYAKPLLPPGAIKDLVSGIGEHLPGVPQIMGAGDAINDALQGKISSTDDLKKSYEAGRLRLPGIQDKATEDSPIANRIGQAGGLVGGTLAGGNSIKGMAALGGLMAASQGKTPILAGNAQDRDQALGEIEKGIGLGGALGLGGKIVGKVADTALSSPAAKAFLASMNGAKLTGPGAMDEAGQTLLRANENASQGVEALRKQIGAARDSIEESHAGKSVDLSESLTHMIKRFKNLTGSARVEAEKEGLMDIAMPEAPYTEVNPVVKDVPAIPGTKEKLMQQGEIAVQKEAALGNEASYELVPGKDSQDKDLLSLVLRKRSAPTSGMGENLVKSEGGSVENELQSMAEDQGLEQPKLESSPENYASDNVSVKPQYLEEGTPATQETSFKSGEVVPNRQPIASDMPLKQALEMRTKLRSMAVDMDLHPDVRQAARDGLQYLQGDLKTQVPELAANDAQYAALKNAQKLFGKKYNAQDQLIQSTKQGNLLERSSKDTLSGVSAKQQLKNAMEEVRKVSPDLADKMEQSLNGSLENYNLTKQVGTADINLSSLRSSVVKNGAWLGAKAGEGVNSVANTPILKASKSLYSASDEALKGFTSKLGTSGGATGQRLADALNAAIDNKNVMAKNAVLFSIMQNPMLRNLVGTDHEDGP